MNAETAIAGSWDRRGVAEPKRFAAPAAFPVTAGAPACLSCHFYPPDALPAEIVSQWDVLADEAAQPNVFAERWFLGPSLHHLADTANVRIAVVTSSDGLLAGLLPLTVKSHYGRIPVRNVQNWRHDNAFLGTPMVRRGIETGFWSTLLSALDDRDWATGLLHIDGLVENGPLHRGLKSAAKRCDTVHRVERALLRSDLAPEVYWAGAVRKKKRKEINRLSNRLAEQGDLAFATLGATEEAAPWIDAFLALERKGWKGAAGSALACNANVAAFFRDACLGGHRARKLDFHRLDLDGRPIAMLINFLAAPGGYSFKIAFDEDYAHYSPGVLIERYNLRILERRDIEWIDSCASQDHPMIDSLWQARRRIVRVTLPLQGRRNRAIFHACRAVENGFGRAKTMLGKLRKRSS
ncbi:MAG: GNAT family N-acetyltransferase [Sphingomonadaceae bacterium]|nr:GNAT family N-acetyltransferase [Sphingomonadaceae bacterium]